MFVLDPDCNLEVPWWLVTSLRNRYRLKTFVETGTGYGPTAITASRLFPSVHTIEINPEVFARQRPALLAAKNVHRYCGKSVEILPQILKTLQGPALFYLDAHWAGSGPVLDKTECPLLEELRLVGQRSEANDVLIIDNAGLLLTPPDPPHRAEDWPTALAVQHAVREANIHRHLTVFADVFVATREPLLQAYGD